MAVTCIRCDIPMTFSFLLSYKNVKQPGKDLKSKYT